MAEHNVCMAEHNGGGRATRRSRRPTVLPSYLSGKSDLIEARMPFLAATEGPAPGTGSSAVSR